LTKLNQSLMRKEEQDTIIEIVIALLISIIVSYLIHQYI
jgi:hypothetical protein